MHFSQNAELPDYGIQLDQLDSESMDIIPAGPQIGIDLKEPNQFYQVFIAHDPDVDARFGPVGDFREFIKPSKASRRKACVCRAILPCKLRANLYDIPMQELLNRIICGDCIEVLNQVDEPFADLIFADPPFNIGYKYDKYYDKVKKKNYIAWTKEWMTVCKRVLKPHGSFYIAIGDDYAANVKIIGDDLGLVMRNWIIWHYTFGQQTKNKFARAHTHIFYFVNDPKKFTFNDHAVRVPSDRQLIYNDRRANPLGKMPDDVWDGDSRVCGTFRERAGWHPCQMPESLLKRIVAASSNPGDCVLDPFSGSGTTVAAACQMGRNYVGIEISETYVKHSTERLTELKSQISNLKFQSSGNLFLDKTELAEVKRLSRDMQISPRDIAADRNLLKLFANQFAVRMNNQKQYSTKEIVTALEDME